jgi:anti-sigma regulatory factor (Ser/Thr protein kinase)
MPRLLRIGEVSQELGIALPRLRQLVDSGVIPAERSPGGHRVFDPGAVRSALAALARSDLVPSRWSSPDWEQTLAAAGLQEDAVWATARSVMPQDMWSVEGRQTANYSFTEMLNNAIDHSQADTVHVSLWLSRIEFRFEIEDHGRGALPNLQEQLNLEDAYDAIGELSKGRTTTDPERHSGEGIFFTSKAVDVFTLESAGLRWTVDNVRHDQAVGSSEVVRGTRIRCEMDPGTTQPLADIFRAFTDEEHQFARTRTVVRLFGFGVRFVSRSEAKRLMRGLERFEQVTLDFAGVEEVGQGFVDEALRVWPRQNPGTVVEPVGMTGPVEFMVRRGLPPTARGLIGRGGSGGVVAQAGADLVGSGDQPGGDVVE